MNKERENNLLAFFVANASEQDVNYHIHTNTCFVDGPDGREYVRENNPHKEYRTREEAKFEYAKTMLEKYKEFCNL